MPRKSRPYTCVCLAVRFPLFFNGNILDGGKTCRVFHYARKGQPHSVRGSHHGVRSGMPYWYTAAISIGVRSKTSGVTKKVVQKDLLERPTNISTTTLDGLIRAIRQTGQEENLKGRA